MFADVAQPDQARIVGLNSQYFLKNGGFFVISIKVGVAGGKGGGWVAGWLWMLLRPGVGAVLGICCRVVRLQLTPPTPLHHPPPAGLLHRLHGAA